MQNLPSFRQLLHAIVQLMKATTGEISRQLVTTHPELLSDEADVIIETLIAQAREQGDTKTQRRLLGCRGLLRSYRAEVLHRGEFKRPPALQVTLDNLAEAMRANNVPQCIQLAQQALTMVEREDNPPLWAGLHATLAYILTTTHHIEQAEHLEQARFHWHQALSVFTRQQFPDQWAGVQNALAAVYVQRIRGEREENLEQALIHCQQAIQVHTREAFPEQWACVQAVLGTIYAERLRDMRAENIECAIHHCHQALEVLDRRVFPVQWAGAQVALGVAHMRRIRGERTENRERAIYYHHQALEVLARETSSVEWAMAHANLIRAYSKRLRDEPANNLVQAVYHARQAARVFTHKRFPTTWAVIQINLGIAYGLSMARVNHRPFWGRRAKQLEYAIRHFQKALNVFTAQDFPERWAELQNNLGLTYTHRVRGDRADNLEHAIAHCQQALDIFTCPTFPEKWAGVQNNLALAYTQRLQGEWEENLAYATRHYDQALSIYTQAQWPNEYRMAQQNLGNLYFNSGAWEKSHAAYNSAIEAGTLLQDAAYTEPGRLAEIAEVAEVYSADAYCLLCLRRPSEALLRLEQGRTRLLAEAFVLNEASLTTALDPQQLSIREAWQTVRNLEAEYRHPQSTMTRQRDRGHELAEALRQARLNLNQLIATVRTNRPDFLPRELDLSHLLTLIPPDGALVAPMITARGSAVFVLPHGIASVTKAHLVPLDTFTDEDVRTLLLGPPDALEPGGWVKAYADFATNPNQGFETWFGVIENTGRTLWDAMLGPVHARLSDFGLPEGAPVILMPQKRLGLLPLHAAWREVHGVKRTFLDDYSVSYIPSGAALSVAHHRLQEPRRQNQTLLAVVDPTSGLQSAMVEGQAVTALFDQAQCQILAKTDATPEAVAKAVRGKAYLHFACHGFHDWQDPMRSGLRLAGDMPLTMAEMITQLDLSAARLVTLSACETGLIDIRRTPDECLGLPTGFILAGAPGVVSTLWPVDDEAACRLMERFYALHLHDGLPPSQALRAAQLWLRDGMPGKLQSDQGIHAVRGFTTPLRDDDIPEEISHEHPWFWAGFTFTGV